MRIADENKLSDIQNAFNSIFPHLQIRFYKKPHADHEGSAAKEEWPNTMNIGEIRSKQSAGELQISKDMKVEELEQLFEDRFGLHVQIFRESTGGLWLQTTATDSWTLERQNQRAKELLLKKT